MDYPVLVEPALDDGYLATAMGLPECRHTAATEEEALSVVGAALRERLSRGRIVRVEIPDAADPWAAWVGRFASDPTWDEFQALMTADRKAVDEASQGA
jgi:hypothetical protein